MARGLPDIVEIVGEQLVNRHVASDSDSTCGFTANKHRCT